MADVKIPIENLDPTAIPTRTHFFPAMKDGLSVKISLGQILDVLVEGAPTALDTWLELVDALEDDENAIAAINTALGYRLRFDAAQALSIAQKTQLFANGGFGDGSPDFIEGMKFAPDVSNPTTHVTLASGRCKTGNVVLINGANFTKRLDQTWVAGSGNGGLDVGTKTAGVGYFLWALRKLSDGSFDYLFSSSATAGGVNTTALGGLYDVQKLIGVLPALDGSALIRPFVMNADDDYTLVTPTKEAVSLAVSTTNAALAVTAVPAGVKVEAKLRAQYQSSTVSAAALIHSPDQGTLTVGISNDGASIGNVQVTNNVVAGAIRVWTDTSKNVRQVAGAAGSLWVWCDGFKFPCGRKG